MLTLEKVPAFMVPARWPAVSDLLETAVRRCKDDTMANVLRECVQASAQLWIVRNDERIVGTFVTEVLQGPTRRVMELRYLAGAGFRRWIALMPEILEWARSARCDDLRFRGRSGWPRYLSGVGWEQSAVEMEYHL